MRETSWVLLRFQFSSHSGFVDDSSCPHRAVSSGVLHRHLLLLGGRKGKKRAGGLGHGNPRRRKRLERVGMAGACPPPTGSRALRLGRTAPTLLVPCVCGERKRSVRRKKTCRPGGR